MNKEPKVEICRFCNKETKFSKIPGRRVCEGCFILKFVFNDECERHELCLVFKPNKAYNYGEIVHRFPYKMSYIKIKFVTHKKAACLNDISNAAIKKDIQRKKNFYYNLLSNKLDLPNELITMIAELC
ncbi:hypothetical protein PV-S19_0100 [Pacmanvirus S19]|nr:hypothetical protein PV-S19_0100 [Pacmanvirus S19]